MFNISLTTGSFPKFWKHSFLKPIHKSGPKDDVKNYRAICNQSEIPKLFDCLITKKLSWDTKNVNNSQQHGFSQGKSTCTNLVLYENFILNAFESRLQVDSIYTDFSKAFDRVNHRLLIGKLSALGINSSLLNWINSYLQDRIQYVKYGSTVSSAISVTSGVPQGSHIGPLLFNLFVKDIANVIDYSEFLMFADDLKLYRIIENVSDAESLQRDLNNLSQWCNENLLNLNINKCHKITFFRINEPVLYTYKIDNIVLNALDTVKDLGVMFDSKMTFRLHITNSVSRSFKMLGFIQRSARDFSVSSIKLLYCALVRSIIEYNSIIWCPNYKVQIDLIENIQKKFLRFCAYRLGLCRGNYNYEEILGLLNITTLEHRRCEADLRFLHKILNGNINCPEILASINFNVPVRRTRVSDTFVVPFHHSNYGQNEPLTRIVRTANLHCKSLELFNTSSSSIKKQVKKL